MDDYIASGAKAQAQRKADKSNGKTRTTPSCRKLTWRASISQQASHDDFAFMLAGQSLLSCTMHKLFRSCFRLFWSGLSSSQDMCNAGHHMRIRMNTCNIVYKYLRSNTNFRDLLADP